MVELPSERLNTDVNTVSNDSAEASDADMSKQMISLYNIVLSRSVTWSKPQTFWDKATNDYKFLPKLSIEIARQPYRAM